ncbi:MAG: hypothetical protein KF716_21870 [Anaerolineae bacterium]|nr:hypothetical protein [Anaerolineae bacterium]
MAGECTRIEVPSSPNAFSGRTEGRIGAAAVVSAMGQAGTTTGRGSETGALLQKSASSRGLKGGGR